MNVRGHAAEQFDWPPWCDLVRRVRAVVSRRAAGLQAHDQQDIEQGVLVRLYRYRQSHPGDRVETPIGALVRLHAGWEIQTHFRRRRHLEPTPFPSGEIDPDDLPDGAAEDPALAAQAREWFAGFRACLRGLTRTQRRRYLGSVAAKMRRERLDTLATRLETTLASLKDSLKIARGRMRECMTRKGFLAGSPPPTAGRHASRKVES